MLNGPLLNGPLLNGPVSVVTGATGGLGYATAVGLAQDGRRVVLTGRDQGRGEAALARLGREVPGAAAGFELLDLASLRSVAAFAERAGSYGSIDVLVNNAGVMALPTRQTTEDGFELQFGTNYLGHFALTGRLLPLLRGARVVSVSSLAHRRAAIHFDDLQGAREYLPWVAYGQSKLAMLMFARELQARAMRNGWPVTSIAAHPGWAATSIILNGPGAGHPGLRERVMQAGFSLVGQSVEAGARPILFAATSPAAAGGGYYGPGGLGEIRGALAPSRVRPQAADPEAARRLWAESERLTGVAFRL